ncbi:NUDIX hydrolase domain-like protein [Protomyces lactucae-debilis]|uniref:NUDIX hydrolase domain-like protein n=1 Tax=Protomyces lactucae-debilis TaxID=2754530 RepID=A0A1Y2FDL0_PROLT|nr:NUDIX hydrolase domain-like protein [Protomyces lactucae-debilis]ORY82001.1 NUDIX hydrolase domain-like protein [Protomyces lactucae-debilis]
MIEDMLARLARHASPPQVTAAVQNLPATKHASVLVLLYPSPTHADDLEVILTLRASHMRSHAGDVSFPGGRRDPGEHAWQCALREAHEEIGLSPDTPFRRITILPYYLAKNNLLVSPCVAFSPTNPHDRWTPVPNLDEVAEIFNIRLSQILQGEGYDGRWLDWHDSRWKLHKFQLHGRHDEVEAPEPKIVWGLTARILVDVARLAYGKNPTVYDFADELGDSDRIERAVRGGHFDDAPRKVRAKTANKSGDTEDTVRRKIQRGAL